MLTLRIYFLQLIVLVVLLATLAYAIPRLAQVVSTVLSRPATKIERVTL